MKKSKVMLKTILLVMSIFYIFPLIWMIVNSFKPDVDIANSINSINTILPSSNMSFENYVKIIRDYHINNYIVNTLIYAFFAIIFGIVINGLAGFALAKIKFPFSDKIVSMLLFFLIIPMETAIITIFIIINNLGLSNTIFGYLLPTIASPFFIYMFRQFFIQIEDEIEEAASLDGASTLRYFFEFVVPMSKPIIATVSVFIFLAIWNDFLWPVLVFNDNSKMPVQIGLNALFNNRSVTLGEKLASLTVVTIPVVLVYSFFQRYIIQGVASVGSSKE